MEVIFFSDVVTFFALALVAFGVAWKLRLFEVKPDLLNSVSGFVVASGFGIFFFALFFIRFLAMIPIELNFYLDWDLSHYLFWVNLFDTTFAAFALVLFTLFLKKQGVDVWLNRSFSSFFKGALSWLIVFPIVLFVGHLVMFLVSLVYPDVFHIEQVAVKNLKEQQLPLFYWSMGILVFTVVPFVEEVLFRGFLHSWLRKRLGIFWGTLLTACVFSLFHYSYDQGIGNIQVLIAIFVLSIFLSITYEKFRSLWGPIGLHSTYNLATFILITAGKA